MIFHKIGLHAPDFDENLHDHIYVTRRITAFYSRGRNSAVGVENEGFSKIRSENSGSCPAASVIRFSLFKYKKKVDQGVESEIQLLIGGLGGQTRSDDQWGPNTNGQTKTSIIKQLGH